VDAFTEVCFSLLLGGTHFKMTIKKENKAFFFFLAFCTFFPLLSYINRILSTTVFSIFVHSWLYPLQENCCYYFAYTLALILETSGEALHFSWILIFRKEELSWAVFRY